MQQTAGRGRGVRVDILHTQPTAILRLRIPPPIRFSIAQTVSSCQLATLLCHLSVSFILLPSRNHMALYGLTHLYVCAQYNASLRRVPTGTRKVWQCLTPSLANDMWRWWRPLFTFTCSCFQEITSGCYLLSLLPYQEIPL
jgi:hypothetical protein